MSTIFMFSGQGSQYYQMGKALYEQDVCFRQHLTALDNIIIANTHISVTREIYAQENTISTPLEDTLLSSLAIYAVELALVKSLNDRGIYADKLIGSSLGTIVASVAAKCLSEEEGIQLMLRQCQIFEEKTSPGSMIAILAPLEKYEEDPILKYKTFLAGINFNGNFIVSVAEQHQYDVISHLRSSSLSYQKMPISKAYHSPWIENAKQGFIELYASLGNRKPKIPLFCSSQTQELEMIDANTLWNAVRKPMYFQELIHAIERSGPHRYIDVGPSGVLASLLKYILPKTSTSVSIPLVSPLQRSATIDYESLRLQSSFS